jgi:hypothetical protein
MTTVCPFCPRLSALHHLSANGQQETGRPDWFLLLGQQLSDLVQLHSGPPFPVCNPLYETLAEFDRHIWFPYDTRFTASKTDTTFALITNMNVYYKCKIQNRTTKYCGC